MLFFETDVVLCPPGWSAVAPSQKTKNQTKVPRGDEPERVYSQLFCRDRGCLGCDASQSLLELIYFFSFIAFQNFLPGACTPFICLQKGAPFFFFKFLKSNSRFLSVSVRRICYGDRSQRCTDPVLWGHLWAERVRQEGRRRLGLGQGQGAATQCPDYSIPWQSRGRDHLTQVNPR